MRATFILAVPPPCTASPTAAKTIYARDEAHKDALLKSEFNANAKVDVGPLQRPSAK